MEARSERITQAGSFTEYLAPVDGVRALAALSVFGFHCWSRHLPGGFLGVDVFFAISGYLITRTLMADVANSGRIHIGAFYVRRARRLFPALVAMLALAYALWPHEGPPFASAARAALLYYANWKHLLDGPESLGWLAHTWSLSVEEQFYLFWPITAGLILHTARSRRAAAITTLAVVAVLAIVRAWGQAHGSWIAGYGSTFARMDELLLGSAFALLPVSSRRVDSPGWFARWASAAALLPFLVLLFTASWRSASLPYGGYTAVGLLSAAVVRDVATHPGSYLARLLSWKPLIEIGKRSYGIYLFHCPIIEWLARRRQPGIVSLLVISLLQISITLAVAWVSFRFIERPFLRKQARQEVCSPGKTDEVIGS